MIAIKRLLLIVIIGIIFIEHALLYILLYSPHTATAFVLPYYLIPTFCVLYLNSVMYTAQPDKLAILIH